jgi:hypothetical protein
LETEARAAGAEGKVDTVLVDATTTFGSVIDLHIRNLAEVGKPLLRSKAFASRS